jgi:hypothetical protein
MEQLGLGQTITRNGKVYRLPSGLYLGVDVPAGLALLNLRIFVSALKITGHGCKMALWHIDDPASISISGLEEIAPSFWDAVGAFDPFRSLGQKPLAESDPFGFFGHKPL